MAFTDLRNYSTGGNGRGSELMAIAEVTNTDNDNFTLGCIFSAPWIMDSNLARTATTETLQGEGTYVKKLPGTIEDTLTITFGQRDAATKDFLMYGMQNKTFCFVKKETGAEISGAHHWRVYAMVEEDPSFTVNAIGNEIEKAFFVVENAKDLTFDLTTFNSAGGWAESLTCTTFVVPAKQRHALYSQAVS